MAIIRLHTKLPDSEKFDINQFECDSVAEWLVDNIKKGENFQVYSGGISRGNEISRDVDKIFAADDVDVFLLPGGATALIFLVAVVITAVLTPKVDVPSNVNRQQQSPNNSLSNRNNIPRPNQRIVDICGKVKSILDVLVKEFAQYNNNTEERYGYYCVARNKVQIEDIKDGESFIADTDGASAGVYYPNKSPNNSTPDIQIGDPINELVKGVYQSADAIGQTLESPNSGTLKLNSNVFAYPDGYIEDLSGEFVFSDYFEAGDSIILSEFYYDDFETDSAVLFGYITRRILEVTETRVTFDISSDPTWNNVPFRSPLVGDYDPRIEKTENKTVGPFIISSQKIDELVVNVYAPNGMYKENSNGKGRATVNYDVIYQKLDENLNPVGPETTVNEEISGIDSKEKGKTTKISLGAATYVRWSLTRTTDTDFDFNGQVVDEIKLKDVFGRWDLGVTDFGNVTTIQTKRTSTSQTTAIKTPELNCIATEMVYKYLGGGVFDTELTPNTQAIQSLIRMALDPYIGRRELSELDADSLLEIQADIETYFQSANAGSFNYSFDSTKLSAQETFFNIGQAVFTTFWREGRVLKGWFEKPQSIPAMVFTHRSKQLGNETWSRNLNGTDKKDSVEFVYTDDKLYTQETLYYPSERSGTNPLKIEMPGVKGLELATWQMMRAYNKLKYQEISVDFGATQEGKFVRPKRMISVVKGSRINTFDGNIVATNGLLYTLSQTVSFTDGDDHYLILKNRDGSTESILVAETENPRVVQALQIPTSEPYTGNDALKTEFSFGNEARLSGQLIIPETITPNGEDYVKITGINYTDEYYKDDPTQPLPGGYSDGYSGGYN